VRLGWRYPCGLDSRRPKEKGITLALKERDLVQSESNPRTSRHIGVLKTSLIRRRVRTVIVRPASICCQ